jgi:Putative zinc-finger
MTHLEFENLVSDYLERQLDTVRQIEVEAHLAECTECRELLAAVQSSLSLCAESAEVEAPPWLVHKILRATVGDRKPTLREQIAAFFRPSAQPRLAYAVAMAIFSFSIIINAAGINLRNLTIQDLNPTTWYSRATRSANLLYARAEKYYYDLRVVYEIESRFRQLRSAPSGQEEKETPRHPAPQGGSSDTTRLASPQLAVITSPAPVETEMLPGQLVPAGPGRSSTR